MTRIYEYYQKVCIKRNIIRYDELLLDKLTRAVCKILRNV